MKILERQGWAEGKIQVLLKRAAHASYFGKSLPQFLNGMHTWEEGNKMVDNVGRSWKDRGVAEQR